MAADFRQVGTVTRPHGLRGEVKVRPDTDDPERFVSLRTLYLGTSAETARMYVVEAARIQPMGSGPAVVLTLEGVADRDAAASLYGLEVYASEADLPGLADDEVYLSDLVGCIVVGVDGSSIGEVIDVLDLPAQAMLVIRGAADREVMVPFVDAFVDEVDIDARRIVLTPVEGLLDTDAQETVR